MRKRVNFASYLEYQPVLLLGHTSTFQALALWTVQQAQGSCFSCLPS